MAEDAAVQSSARPIENRVRVVIAANKLSATVTIRTPLPDERSITVEDIARIMAEAHVTYGIEQEAIAKGIASRVFDVPFKVATGIMPRKGTDAHVELLCNIDQHHSPKVGEDGRIDYHDMNTIQSVEGGTVLARKTPPGEGTPGTAVDGKPVPAQMGRDFPFKYGDNVVVSDDGLELVAKTSGGISYRQGKVTVNEVVSIPGNIDFSVGNLDCIGSVKVRGDIQAGFTVKVGGDLEVSGNVEDAEIDVKGDILIKGGCFGKGTKVIHADGDVTLKYAEGQHITSGRDIIVGGELINCNVTAKEKVLLKGKNGKIIGGETNAGKEIHAASFGSDAGTVTRLTVAFDAELLKQYRDTTGEIGRLNSDNERVKESLYALYRLQMDGNLPPAKKQVLEKLEEFQKSLPEALASLDRKKGEIEEKLKQYQDAQIIVEEELHPGVTAYFGIVYRSFDEKIGKCRLILDGDQVMTTEIRKDKD